MYCRKEYCYKLNSPDIHDPDLPMQQSKAHGGTIVMWKRSLHPFISIYPLTTSSFLPLVFHPPGTTPSIHICVYLPTCGREQEFIRELSGLSAIVDKLHHDYSGSPIYLRGDFNVSNNNKKRKVLFDNFMHSECLVEVAQTHPSYHHFTGDGKVTPSWIVSYSIVMFMKMK